MLCPIHGARYYYRKGVVSDYVIHLEGGGGCSTEATCKAWAAQKGSSRKFEKVKAGASLPNLYNDFDIVLHRISRLSQPCTAPHALCAVLFLVATRVEC